MNMIQGKVIIITGASSGIGAATARELARRGANVVLAARRQDKLDQLVDEIMQTGGKALAVVTDMTNWDDYERLVVLALERFGRIDVLFNNAGMGFDAGIMEHDAAMVGQLFSTNIGAVIRLTQIVVPHMRRQGGGHIITTGSVASHIASPGLYATTKFAVRGFSDSLRRELWHDGIHVSLVSPGFIRTEMTTDVPIPMPGPAVVARAVVGLIERPRREVVVPGWYRLFIWLNALAPWLVDRLVSRGNRQTLRAKRK